MPIINMVYKKKKGWKPGANTIAYYPLTSTSTVNDMSGNNRNLTNSGVAFNTYDGVNCAYFNGSSYAMVSGLNLSLSGGTMNIWLKRTRAGGENFGSLGSLSPDGEWRIYGDNSAGKLGHLEYIGGWIINGYNNTGISTGTWINVTSVMGSSGNKFYVNGQEVTLTYSNGNSSTAFGDRVFTIINIGRHRNASVDWMQGYVSNWIIENRQWTAQEILDYYNQTKANYGL